MVYCGVVWCGMAWYGKAFHGMAWDVMAWYDIDSQVPVITSGCDSHHQDCVICYAMYLTITSSLMCLDMRGIWLARINYRRLNQSGFRNCVMYKLYFLRKEESFKRPNLHPSQLPSWNKWLLSLRLGTKAIEKLLNACIE